MIIAETNVIIGLSITKILKAIREIVHKIDCIAVVLKKHFFELLNIEKIKQLLIKYLIILIDVINIKRFHLILYKLIT